MGETLTIPGRFNGPPGSGQGGYVCGALANHVESSAVEVTLCAPPPLDKPLTVERGEGGSAILRDGELTIAQARPAVLEMEIPPAPSEAQCRAAEENYPGFDHHAFPGCFGCGPEREAGDGLRIFSGPVDGTGMMAGLWEPAALLALPSTERIGAELLWAALDCPSGWAVKNWINRDFPDMPYFVLGSFVGQSNPGLAAGARCRVFGWPIAAEGRKFTSGVAMVDGAGELWGAGKAIWIVPRAALG